MKSHYVIPQTQTSLKLIPADQPRVWDVTFDERGYVKGSVGYTHAEGEAVMPYSRHECCAFVGVYSNRLIEVRFQADADCRAKIELIREFLSQLSNWPERTRLNHQIALDNFPVEELSRLLTVT